MPLLPPSDTILAQLSIEKPSLKNGASPLECSQYRAITHWLTRYRPRDNSNLTQVTGLIQAFKHLCDLQHWQAASQLLTLRLNTPTQEELDNQLHTWGYYQTQITLYDALLHKLNDEWDAILFNGLGIAHNSLGNHRKALHYNQQQQSIAHTLNKPLVQARCLGNTGLTHHCLGHFEKAIALYNQQLGIARHQQHTPMMIQALAGMGSSHYQLKQYNQALSCYQLQQSLMETVDDAPGQAKLQNNLGNLHFARGDLAQAQQAYQSWLTHTRQIGDRAGESHARQYRQRLPRPR